MDARLHEIKVKLEACKSFTYENMDFTYLRYTDSWMVAVACGNGGNFITSFDTYGYHGYRCIELYKDGEYRASIY